MKVQNLFIKSKFVKNDMINLIKFFENISNSSKEYELICHDNFSDLTLKTKN